MLNIALIIKILGFLLTGLASTMALPAGMAAYFKEPEFMGLAVSTVVTLVCGLLLARVRAKNKKFHLRTSIGIVVLGWLLCSFFGALPYIFCNILSITDAVFETMSGFTTTGATVLLDIEVISRSILFWRSLTQWLGGMGIIVLSLAIMPLLGSSGSVLYRAEVPGPSSDKLMPRLQATAKILWLVYFVFTAVMAVLLKIFGLGWYDAINHALTTLSTGGFSTKNASIVAFSTPAVQWIIILFMFIGGANYSLHYRMFVSGDIRGFIKNREFFFYLMIILLAAFSITFKLAPLTDFESSIRRALFQVVSFVTTTGYVNDDFEKWGQFPQFILFLLMFVGGCGGSTGGGIKVIRLYVTAKVALVQIHQFLHPYAVSFIKVGKTTISEDMVGRVMGFIILYGLLLGLSSLLLTFFGHDFITAFSAAAACLGNIGPGFGEVGATDNYFLIHDAAKWILVICMLAGRLEIFTVLVLFSKRFWKR